MTIVRHKRKLSDKAALTAWDAGEPFTVLKSDVIRKGAVIIKGDISNVIYSCSPIWETPTIGYRLD
jgi:hypothetical protein